jgi:hypothetical protein
VGRGEQFFKRLRRARFYIEIYCVVYQLLFLENFPPFDKLIGGNRRTIEQVSFFKAAKQIGLCQLNIPR